MSETGPSWKAKWCLFARKRAFGLKKIGKEETVVLFCFECVIFFFWTGTTWLQFWAYNHSGCLEKIQCYSTYCSGFKMEGGRKGDHFHGCKNQFRMPLLVLCLCTRVLRLLWTPPQEGFKALLGTSICRSSSSERFWNWDLLSPFIVKVIEESHINLAQKHLIVKARSVITDKKSQGKYWNALLSFTWVVGSESHDIQSYLSTWSCPSDVSSVCVSGLLFDKIYWNHWRLWSHLGWLQHFCKSIFSRAEKCMPTKISLSFLCSQTATWFLCNYRSLYEHLHFNFCQILYTFHKCIA